VSRDTASTSGSRPPADSCVARDERAANILQQIISLLAAQRPAPEKPQQARTDGSDEDARRIRITILITLRPAIQSDNRLIDIGSLKEQTPSMYAIRSRRPWSCGPEEVFSKTACLRQAPDRP
jgi:hypothetical protein